MHTRHVLLQVVPGHGAGPRRQVMVQRMAGYEHSNKENYRYANTSSDSNISLYFLPHPASPATWGYGAPVLSEC